jgi:hypothetical protein
MEQFQFIAAVLPYLVQPKFVIAGCAVLCFLGVLWRVADPAIVGHLTQEGAATTLGSLMRYGFAVVCLVVVALLLGLGG